MPAEAELFKKKYLICRNFWIYYRRNLDFEQQHQYHGQPNIDALEYRRPVYFLNRNPVAHDEQHVCVCHCTLHLYPPLFLDDHGQLDFASAKTTFTIDRLVVRRYFTFKSHWPSRESSYNIIHRADTSGSSFASIRSVDTLLPEYAWEADARGSCASSCRFAISNWSAGRYALAACLKSRRGINRLREVKLIACQQHVHVFAYSATAWKRSTGRR